MNTILKRVVSMLLCFVLMAGYLPAGAFATESGDAVATEPTVVATEPSQVSVETTAATTATTGTPTEPSTEAATELPSETPSEVPTETPTEAPTEAPTEPAVIAVTGITLDVTTLEVGVGAEPVTLTATVMPEDATDKTVTWTSSESGVASVVDGVVTFGYMGEAVITATAGEFSATCTVTVGEGETLVHEYTGPAYVDAVVFGSDIHGSPDTAKTIMASIATSGLKYSTATFVGDTFSDTAGKKADVTSQIRSGLGDTGVECLYAWGDHDYKSDIENFTGLLYGGESTNYYIYTISMSAMTDMGDSKTNLSSTYSTDLLDAFTAAVKAMDHSKPLFIATHMPLHARRGDNDYAYNWYQVIEAAAEQMDVVVFWAHNHTGDNGSNYDSTCYFLKPGSKIEIAGANETQTLNFTYTNAGYINPPNGSGRKNVATSVTIFDDSMEFVVYDKNGEYSSSTYATGGTVKREFASDPVTLTSIAVTTAPNTVEYTVGDTFSKEGLVVTATYSDSSTETVTDYTLSEVDMTTAGEKEVTVTYEGKTASFKITVKSAEPTVNTVDCFDDSNQVVVTATGLGLTKVTAINVTGDNTKCDEIFTKYGYMAFDIALTGLVEGASVKYSISVVPDLDTTNLELYYIDENGELIPVEYKLTTDELNNVYVEFTTDKVGTFVYGSPKVPEGYVLTSLTLANIPTDMILGGSLVLDETAEVTATYTKEGAEDFVRKLTSWDYDYTNFTDFDVNVGGKQTVTFTFEGVTATHDIYVWGGNLTASGVTVTLDPNGEDFGVTAVKVAESTNTHVAEAVANVLADGYVAYDISLVYAENYAATDAVKTVTMPIPEGVVNPAVYYVSDNGYNVVDMKAEKTADGTGVTFNTTHFSTYVVGEGTEITVPDPDDAENVTGTITTITNKTIYKLVSSLTAGEEYLIVSSNSAGSGYGLASSTTGESVTVKAADNISSVVYIEDKSNALEWTAASGWKFTSGNYKLGYNNWSLSFNTSTNWAFDNNRLYNDGQWDVYLYCNDGEWGTNWNSANVYFYEKTEVDVETTTTTTGNYSIAGVDINVPAIKNSAVELSSTLTFTANDTVMNPEMDSSKLSYTIYDADNDNTNGYTGDPLGIISKIENGSVILSGNVGKALVKVSYEVATGKVATDYITVETTTPDHYSIQLHLNEGGTLGAEITEPVALKKVEAGDTYSVWAVVKAYASAEDTEGVDIGTLGDALSWTVSDTSIAKIDTKTGVITFTGKNYGTFDVTVAFAGADGKTYTDTITISATDSPYVVPGDGTDDFPEYPKEGAVRFDKTATAVGNFSQTGIAKVELSMTGVPYSTGSAIDVLLMLDMSTSMDESVGKDSNGNTVDRKDVTVAAANNFVETIVKNNDGTFNTNKVAVGYFNGSNVVYVTGNSSSPYVSISDATTLSTVKSNITAIASESLTSSGTYYGTALESCYSKITAQDKVSESTQAFVFMSDGGPTQYTYVNGNSYSTAAQDSASTIVGWFTTNNNNTSDETDDTATPTSSFKTEYYTYKMKQDGYPVYTVGLGLANNTKGPASYTELTSGAHESLTSYILRQMATNSNYFYNIADNDAVANMGNIFSGIAASIKEAATNVMVEDKIGEDYTLNFKLPNTNVTGDETGIEEFYIQVVDYILDSTTHERTGNYSVLENFTFDTNGALKTHSVDGVVTCQGTACTHADFTSGTVTGLDGTFFEYTYAPLLDEEGNEIKNEFGETMTEEFLNWHADKLTKNELVMEYFVYLDHSAGYDADHQVPADTYYTNEYATLTYTNVNKKEVQQEFPVPQMTWNGAQVTYVFYLVNEDGQPVNRAGRVVPFAESVYVTDPVTRNVTWNEETGTAKVLAHDIFATAGVPEVFALFDENAQYVIRVYQTENVDTNGKNGNYFQISGSDDKKIDSALDSDTTVNNSTTVVFNTKAGKKYDAYGIYSIYKEETTLTNGTTDIKTTVKADDIDYANTTVAFAVVWKPELVEDTVVIDYGLDVVIDVIKNDNMAAGVMGVRTDAPSDVTAEGTYTRDKANTLTSVDVLIDSNNDGDNLKENKIGTATVENMNAVRFSMDKNNGMQFTDPAVFYYEADVNYYVGTELKTTSMYSKVTVIPATTVYYEDDFLKLASFSRVDSVWSPDENSKWTATAQNGVQQQDRPGESKISAALDADNVYGYDSAYKTMSTHSLDSAASVHVDSNSYATAEFTFWGTGFDVISVTSNTTGTLAVQVSKGATFDSKNLVRNTLVDTYFGVDENGNVAANTPDTLYQVPVIKIFGMDYGQYTVKITATYNTMLDHTSEDGYDLYLDAIRIYDPAGKTSDDIDDTIENAYNKDGELFPEYNELRNWILAANDFNASDEDVNEVYCGAVFIDGAAENKSVDDYKSYGPNNEVYLMKGQSVAFKPNAAKAGYNANVHIALKSVGGNAKAKISYLNGSALVTAFELDVNTATDLYYDITTLNGKTILIESTGDAVLSITNVKYAYQQISGSSSSGSSSDPAVVEETVEAAPFTITKADVEAILACLNYVEEEEIPETTVPETEPSVPETEPTVPETEPTVPETEPAKPDSSELKAAVEEAKKLKEKDYTKESFKAVKNALKEAEKVLKDKKATQAQIDNALSALSEAVGALKTNAPAAKPDNTKLNAAVEEVKKLNEKDYTKESFKAVKDALKEAEKVLKDKKATQAQIDNALSALNEAVNALKSNAPAAKPEKPGKDEKPGKAENQNKPADNQGDAQKEQNLITMILDALFGWLFG